MSFAVPSPPYISISLFSYLLIVSGSVTMSLGFFGCLGSLKTVKCLLATVSFQKNKTLWIYMAFM